MNTSAKRRTSIATPQQARHSPSAPELAWLQAALGLGIAGVVVLVAVFALAPRGFEGEARAEGAAMPIPAAASRAAGPNSAPAPLSVGPAAPVARLANDEYSESPSLARAPDAETELPQVPAPTPKAPPTAHTASPGPLHTIRSEDDLRLQLRRAPEFGLKPAVRDALVESYKTSYQANAAMSRKPSLDPSILVTRMPSAMQLPLRGFPVCQLPPDRAVTLGVLSRALHAYLDGLAPKDAYGKRGDPTRVREALRLERRGQPPAWLRPEALPAMVQILMAEDVPLRLILVDMMADIPGNAAGARLAQRAVFDLSPEVRWAAIEALQGRPAGEARRTLVDAMRFPWPAAADHAAAALAALGDRGAAPLLVALLDKPDPAAPFATKSGASVHELVRVNHVQNCLLCHVPAVGRGPVTDVDPFARRPDQTYDVGYGGPKLPGSNSGVWANRVLIRADVQFLRQDFSVTFPRVSDFSTAAGLRFDFLVRTRPLKPDEVLEWKNQIRPAAPAYPQREAVLYALRAVTGLDAGISTDAWVALFPQAHAEAEGQRPDTAMRAARPDPR